MTDFVQGEVLFCEGLDMKCRPTVERVQFVRQYDDERVVVYCPRDHVRVITAASGLYKLRGDVVALIKAKR